MLRWVRAEAPGVAAGQGDALLGEPLGQGEAGARLTGGVPRVVDAPQRAPAGMEQHRVAGPDLQAGRVERHCGVGDRDDVTRVEAGGTTGGGDVEQQPAGDDLRQRVDAQPAGAVVLGDVPEAVAVVGSVADLQVVERVEVCTHLLGGRDLLDHPVDVVASQTGRAGAGYPSVDVV